MDKSTIIQLVVCLGGIGSIVAGILYFLSFDSYMKDTDRRVEESEEKSLVYSILIINRDAFEKLTSLL